MLKIVTYPNPILLQKTLPIKLIDTKIKKLITQMREMMLSVNGVGLAANQIGSPVQLAIIENIKSDKEKIPLTVIINPQIKSASREVNIEEEGCLSLPNVLVNVPRSNSITIEALDENSNKRTLTANGLFSRAIQHEIDHLNGILITHYGEPEKN